MKSTIKCFPCTWNQLNKRKIQFFSSILLPQQPFFGNYILQIHYFLHYFYHFLSYYGWRRVLLLLPTYFCTSISLVFKIHRTAVVFQQSGGSKENSVCVAEICLVRKFFGFGNIIDLIYTPPFSMFTTKLGYSLPIDSALKYPKKCAI